MILSVALIASTVASAQAELQQGVTGFIENKGQLVDQLGLPNSGVLFLFNGNGLNVQLRTDGFSYDTWRAEVADNGATSATSMSSRAPENDAATTILFHRVDVALKGASPSCRIEAAQPFDDVFNYYTTGVDERGVIDVRHFAEVTYREVYPHIDMVFRVAQHEEGVGVEYDFVVRPGGDLSKIQLAYAGAPVELSSMNVLQLVTRSGELTERMPDSWHELGTQRTHAGVQWMRTAENTFGFHLAEGRTPPLGTTLVIDPVPTVEWSTMYGGTGYDGFGGVALDASGNTLAAGSTQSTNAIATAGAHQTTLNGSQDGMLVKFNSTGARQWATYIGGSGRETGASVSTDASGNSFVSGRTDSSTGIATAGSHQATKSTGYDGFLMKFNASGVRQWGTYYGGTGDDDANDVQCDGAGMPVMVGSTESTSGIASAGAADVSYGGSGDAFVAKFNTSGVRQWATYLGGSGEDSGKGTSNDGTFIYLVGITASTTGIALGATHQTSKSGGKDGYLVKYTGLGAKAWATYYGGTQDDDALACLAEPSTGRIYICGGTLSTAGIATFGSQDASFNGTSDAFLAKISNTGAREWGTYYGGADTEWFEDIAMGYTGRLYVSGYTESASGIATPDGLQTTLTTTAAFLTRFNTSGSRIWGTYFNGSANWMYANCAALNGTIVLGGDTRSQTVTTTGCHQPTFGGGIFDGYLVRFNEPLFGALMPTAGVEREQQLSKTVDGQWQLVPTPGLTGNATVRIHDLSGRMLAAQQWQDRSVTQLLDLSGLAPGVYVVSTGSGADQRSARLSYLE